MKVLLDEDLDHRLRKTLSNHEVFTFCWLSAEFGFAPIGYCHPVGYKLAADSESLDENC